MEEYHLDRQEEPATDPSLCINCQKEPFQAGYPTRLCAGCRERFIRYPIPKWIGIFAGVVLLLMIAGLIRTPKYIQAAYHLGEAENAMDAHRYRSAQKALLQVLETMPDNQEAMGRLLISSAYNRELSLFYMANSKLAGQPIKDGQLYEAMNQAIGMLEENVPSDTLFSRYMSLAGDSTGAISRYCSLLAQEQSPDCNLCLLYLANAYYDQKAYDKCREALRQVLEKKPDHYAALLLQCALERSTGRYDEAIAICNRLLQDNAEDVIVLGQRSKIELKRGNDGKADEYATLAMSLAPEHLSALEARALVDFYTNRKSESRELLQTIRKLEAGEDTTISKRIADVISGKTKFR